MAWPPPPLERDSKIRERNPNRVNGCLHGCRLRLRIDRTGRSRTSNRSSLNCRRDAIQTCRRAEMAESRSNVQGIIRFHDIGGTAIQVCIAPQQDPPRRALHRERQLRSIKRQVSIIRQSPIRRRKGHPGSRKAANRANTRSATLNHGLTPQCARQGARSPFLQRPSSRAPRASGSFRCRNNRPFQRSANPCC